jgi:hypothetical protein
MKRNPAGSPGFFVGYGDKAPKLASGYRDSVVKLALSTFTHTHPPKGALLQFITDHAQTSALTDIDTTTTAVIVFFTAFSPIGEPTIAILCW